MAVRETHPPPAMRLQEARAVARTIPCGRTRLVWRVRPLIMGILNVTPDSFSDGGTYFEPRSAVQRGMAMVAEGADLIDVGGESTRPGAAPVSTDEELRRVIPVITQLARALHVPLSIDTAKAEVARQALDAGASIVNDVSALRADPQMAGVIAKSQAAVVLMHMRGTPRTMQRRPRYHDVVREVAEFLCDAARQAEERGVERARILLDPGLGFGKTVRHNLELLGGLEVFTGLGYPIVLGPSRKSFIGTTLGVPVGERLSGTLACVARAQQAGVRVVRVHDVQESRRLVEMLEAIQETHATRRER